MGHSTGTVKLPDGTLLPKLGQGTWYMGDEPSKKKEEIRYGGWKKQYITCGGFENNEGVVGEDFA